MEKYWNKLSYQRSDISDCASEPIQFCGAIQNHGWLIAYDEKLKQIEAVSENCAELFKLSLHQLLGSKIEDLLTPASPLTEGLAKMKIHGSDAIVVVSRVQSGPLTLFDIEPFSGPVMSEPALFVDQLRTLIHKVDSENETAPMLSMAAHSVRKLTHFDRVMIYRFEPNWDGYVIAESAGDKNESFLGLMYPASDIPPQARSLYIESKYRCIPDVDSQPISVVTREGLNRADLDLSRSNLRAVSPFHIQYLQNMKVRSSFSVPLKVNGKLWGLISCHHYQAAKFLSSDIRSSCELAAQVISGRLTDQITERRLQVRSQVLQLSQSILNSVTEGRTAVGSFKFHEKELLGVTESPGAYVRLGGEEILIGQTPPLEWVHHLTEKLQSIAALGVWQNQNVSDEFKLPAHEYGIGALSVPLSFGFEDLIIWFRPESVREITWGGNPQEKTTSEDVLTPRSSFKIWTESVRGKSREWNESAQEGAQFVLFTFIQGIFQKASDLSKANIELARVTQAKDEFIGMVSHELRTPLGVMIGWIEILKEEGSFDPLFVQGLETIDRNAKLQIGLINDLLDVSRIISGKMRINPQENIDLQAVITEVAQDLQLTATAKSVAVKVEILSGAVTSADPDRMRQIIWNLLSNAIKFTPKGGCVTLTLNRNKSAYQISVSDTGVGIPQDQLVRIFDRFAQAKEGHTALGGLGLGLSIVRSLVELHGGFVIAASEGRDRGSIFTASFPIFSLKAQVDLPLRPRDEKIPSGAELKGLRVLIVEDNSDAATALEHRLKKMGAITQISANGRDALELLRSGEFDLLLSDVGMPIMDGFELVKNLRQLEAARGSSRLPAIALTAYATSKDRAHCLEAGFQNHIAKPADRAELLAVIRSLTE